MTYTITFTKETIQQILWAIDLTENTLEGLSDQELNVMNIDIDRSELFALAETLEEMITDKAGA